MALSRYIKTKGLTSNPNGRTVGSAPSKDMVLVAAGNNYAGYTFPTNTYHFGDLGQDAFDGYGHFTLTRVSDGAQAAIPFSAGLNGPDGTIYSQDFAAHGVNWRVEHGWPVTGIFRIHIRQLDGSPFDVRMFIGGNWGADGNDSYGSATGGAWTGNLSGATRHLQYAVHSDSSSNDPTIYFYWVPYDPALNNNAALNWVRNTSGDSEYQYCTFQEGLTFYISRTMFTHDWIVDDLAEYDSRTKVGTYKFLNGDSGFCTVPLWNPPSGPLRMQGAGGTGSVDLVDVTDNAAGAIRIQTATGLKAVKLDVAFCQHWNSQPYSAPNTTVHYANGILAVTSTTWDPMIEMGSLGSFNPNIYRYIDIRYRVIPGSVVPGTCQIYFYNNQYGSANEANNQSKAYNQTVDGEWRVMTIDMWNHANWKAQGNITGWRFDWSSNETVTMEFDYIRLRA